MSLPDRLATALAPRYTLDGKIAEGGMGVVFLAADNTLQRKVAIKVLKPELATAEMETRFLREARVLAKLAHPNIVSIHDTGVVDGLHYYVMDYIEGETLDARLARGALPHDRVLHIGRELLAALQAVHSVDVVHRDVKPANIFLLEDRVLLGDFGIAYDSSAEDTALTREGSPPMTPRYAAPEQRSGTEVTARTDLYAVGLVLFQCCTGEYWNQEDDSEDGNWIAVPRPLDTALRRALQKRPDKRYADARAFQEALETRRQARPGCAVQVSVGIALAAVAAWLLWPRNEVAPPSERHVDLTIGELMVSPTTDSLGPQMAAAVRQNLLPIPGIKLGGIGDSTIPRYTTESSLVLRGDEWVLRFNLVDSVGGKHAPHRYSTSAALPYGLADSIALGIVEFFFPEIATEFKGQVGRASDNLEAIAEWLAGEIAFFDDQWWTAEGHFASAYDRDPDFALAYWRWFNARQWGRRHTDVDSLATVFREHPDAFSQLDRRLIEARLEPNLNRRLDLLEETFRVYPFRPYAALLRGNELFHRGPLVGRSLLEAIPALTDAQKAGQLAPAYNQILWASIRLGEKEQAQEALRNRTRHGTRLSPGDPPIQLLLELAYKYRFEPDSVAALMREIAIADTTNNFMEYVAQTLRISLSLDIPFTQIELGRRLAEGSGNSVEQAYGHTALGLALIMVGQPGEGLEELDKAAAGWGTDDARLMAWESRLLLPWFGIPVDPNDQDQARQSLARYAMGSASAGRSSWALALDAWRRDDPSDASGHHEAVRLAAASDPSLDFLVGSLDAIALARQGRWDSAETLAASLLEIDAAGRHTDPFARAVLYWSRATWFEDSGQLAAAEDVWLWYENSDWGDVWPGSQVQAAEVDWAVSTYARVRRAKAKLRFDDPGMTRDACELLRRVDELWPNPEPLLLGDREELDSLLVGCRQ